MGAKTNKDTGDVECDLCDRKFFSIQSLRSHKGAKHNKEKVETTEAKTVARVSKRLQMKKTDDAIVSGAENEESYSETAATTTKFACPICDPQKIFPTSFQAVRHIQRKHKSLEDSEPVQIEVPTLEAPPTSQYSSYICLGCNQLFTSIYLFNNHVVASHRDNLDNMFFKSVEEFTMWQHKMQNQVRIKYVPLGSQGLRKHYQCNFVSPKNEVYKTYLCPSVVTTKEVGNGLQVRYSMDHYGHYCPDYECPKEFVSYLTNTVTSQTTPMLFDELIEKKDPDPGLYFKIKKILKSIIDDAASLNPAQLAKVLDAALKVQAILNSFDDNEMEPLVSRNMTDDQISDALVEKEKGIDATKKKRDSVSDVTENSDTLDRKKSTDVEVKRVSARLKRKTDISSGDIKKRKEDDENATPKENKEVSAPKVPKSPVMSPTFVDSYRQFVDTTMHGNSITKPTTQVKTAKKEVLKTKMGQFIPSPERKSKRIDRESDETLTPKSESPILKVSKKHPMRAKKALKSIGNNIKYEVIEQENDCNILVLKI